MKNDRTETEKRLKELATRAYQESRYIFTDFLNPSELSVYYDMLNELSFIGSSVSGGIDNAERCMICFGSEKDFGYEEPFPIVSIEIVPAAKKFAESLTHRDFLGSVMGLGLERKKIGDLIVKDNSAYLFAEEFAGNVIVQELGQVRHTTVRVKKIAYVPEELEPRLIEKRLQVSSNRIDAVISQVYHYSREQALILFRTNKIALNGIPTMENAKVLKMGDVVSVRGKGKFIFSKEDGKTRKDRLNIIVEIYDDSCV